MEMEMGMFQKNISDSYWSMNPIIQQVFEHMNQIELWNINDQQKLDDITAKMEKLIFHCVEMNDSSYILQNKQLFITILSALVPSQFFRVIHFIDEHFYKEGVTIQLLQYCIEQQSEKDCLIFVARIKTLQETNLLSRVLATQNNIVIMEYFLSNGQ